MKQAHIYYKGRGKGSRPSLERFHRVCIWGSAPSFASVNELGTLYPTSGRYVSSELSSNLPVVLLLHSYIIIYIICMIQCVYVTVHFYRHNYIIVIGLYACLIDI